MKQRIAADTKQYWFEPNTAHAKKNLIIMKQRIAADTKQYWFEPNTAHAKKDLIINETAYSCGYETVLV
jgi:hypothetical protein